MIVGVTLVLVLLNRDLQFLALSFNFNIAQLQAQVRSRELRARGSIKNSVHRSTHFVRLAKKVNRAQMQMSAS
jgi:hypothetical protein